MGRLIQDVAFRDPLFRYDVPSRLYMFQHKHAVRAGDNILKFLCSLFGDPQGDAGNPFSALLVYFADSKVRHPVVIYGQHRGFACPGLDITNTAV